MAKSKSEPSVESKPNKCQVSKEYFLANAKPLLIAVEGVPMVGMPKEFSTGSFGWFLNQKSVVDVGGIPVQVQLGFNLTVVNSKPK